MTTPRVTQPRRRRLPIEVVAKRLHVPYAMLRRNWRGLEHERLVWIQKNPSTGKVSRFAWDEDLDALYVKLFWLIFEQQGPTDNKPPHLRLGVPLRVFEQIKLEQHSILDVSHLTKIDDRILRRWLFGESSTNVLAFERFCMDYVHADLFEYIDIRADISLNHLRDK